jgi:hypothetical protein
VAREDGDEDSPEPGSADEIQSQKKKNLLKNSKLLSTLRKWRSQKTKKVQKAIIK